MALESGNYLVKVEKKVVIWKAPDADGDGEEVWEARTDELGREVERIRAKDKWGQEVYSYNPPEGFANRPNYAHQDNYVQVTERGQIVRQPNGEAVGIKPGQAIVFKADGSVEVLTDEYAQHVFAKAHDATNSVVDNVDDDVNVDEAPVKRGRK